MARRRSIFVSIGLLLVAAVAISCSASVETDSTRVSPEVEQEVMRIANQDSRVQNFTAEFNCQYEIITLEPETIAELSKKQPVIYGGLPGKVLYRIDYKSNDKGVLVIVDLEEGEVIKYFRTVGISLD